MTTITATPATITELYAARAAGETTAAMLTDGRDILDISRNDDDTYHLWTSLGEVSNVAGERMVIAPPARTAAPVITYRLPYDAETRDHNCLVKIGDDPEQSIGYAPTFHEAEKKCRQYIDDLLASNLFRPAGELDGVCSCGVTFNEYGQCENCLEVITTYDESGTPEQIAARDAENETAMLEWLHESDVTSPDDPGHAITLPDPAECPDISAPQPIEELSACERYSTAPSLALWGPPNPLCPKCQQAHDPIVNCPNPIAVVAPEHDSCAALRQALTNLLTALADDERLATALRTYRGTFEERKIRTCFDGEFAQELETARAALKG